MSLEHINDKIYRLISIQNSHFALAYKQLPIHRIIDVNICMLVICIQTLLTLVSAVRSILSLHLSCQITIHIVVQQQIIQQYKIIDLKQTKRRIQPTIVDITTCTVTC